MAPGNGKGLSVLWATDGSDSSRSAIPLMRRLVLPATQKLTVLSVAPHSLISGARPDPAFLTRITPAARRRAVLEAEDLAQAAATELDPASIEVEALARWGNPIEEVLRVSRSSRADLVVLGAKGHSNLGLILLGSVSQGVVQYSTRPVLIARPGTDRLRSVLIGFDGTPHARRAVAFLDRLSLAPEVSLRVAYVVEPFALPAGTPASYRRRALAEAQEINVKRDQEAQRSLEALATNLRASGRTVETEVVHGSAGPELDSIARQRGADLIAVGSRKPSPARHYLLGSTAEKLVRHSHVSVLIVR
jgi:nucleotide-binding universal stress UspA family protein